MVYAEFPQSLGINTDGSSFRNGKSDAIAGIGVYFGPKDPRNIGVPLGPGRQTNQRAELVAVKIALEKAPVNQNVVIRSDSIRACAQRNRKAKVRVRGQIVRPATQRTVPSAVQETVGKEATLDSAIFEKNVATCPSKRFYAIHHPVERRRVYYEIWENVQQHTQESACIYQVFDKQTDATLFRDSGSVGVLATELSAPDSDRTETLKGGNDQQQVDEIRTTSSVTVRGGNRKTLDGLVISPLGPLRDVECVIREPRGVTLAESAKS